MKELNPINLRNLTLEDALAHAGQTIRPDPRIGAATQPRDPERVAFDKWWDQKSAEPLNYKDIKHYAWAAWIESHHRTITEISAQVESLKKGKV